MTRSALSRKGEITATFTRHSVYLNIRGRVFEVVYTPEPIQGSKGELLSSSLDWDSGRIIISDRLNDEELIATMVRQYVRIDRRQRELRPLDADTSVSLGESILQFIQDLESGEHFARRLRGRRVDLDKDLVLPLPQTHHSRRALAAMLAIGIPLILGAVGVNAWQYFARQPSMPAPPVMAVGTPLPNLADPSPNVYDLGDQNLLVHCHPHQPWFLCVENDNDLILRKPIEGEAIKLARIDGRVRELAISPTGDFAVVTTWEGDLSLVGLSGPNTPRNLGVENAATAFHSGEDEITWIDSNNRVFTTKISMQATTELEGCVWAATSPTRLGAVARAYDLPDRRRIDVHMGEGGPVLAEYVAKTARLRAVDVAPDNSVAVFSLSTGISTVLRRGPDASSTYEKAEVRHSEVQPVTYISASGDSAYLKSTDLERYALTGQASITTNAILHHNGRDELDVPWGRYAVLRDSGLLLTASSTRAAIWRLR